jgi:hypothetical protein
LPRQALSRHRTGLPPAAAGNEKQFRGHHRQIMARLMLVPPASQVHLSDRLQAMLPGGIDQHTLATQAVNRGMSLEAIAALLGHKSMSMTLTCARISDRTVADECFNVTSQVEALYDRGQSLPAAAGPNMQRLHDETTRRLLGNGYCTRPAELGCHYETICESCTFFATTIEFRDQISAQHNDARRHGDEERKITYLKLLDTLDDTGT